VTWIPRDWTLFESCICATLGSVTVVTLPGVTVNGDVNARPGIVTVPVVAVSPAMNS
jgi:hypothetical protein